MGFILPDDDGPVGEISTGPSGITQSTPVSVPAPSGASYIVTALNATLTAERVLAMGTRMSMVDGGAGSTLTLNADATPAAKVSDLTSQPAAVASTVLYAGAPAGVYMLCAYVNVKTAAAVGTIDAQATYANGGTQTATALTGFSLTALGLTNGLTTFYHTGGDISVLTAITGLVGVPSYDVSFRLVHLG